MPGLPDAAHWPAGVRQFAAQVPPSGVLRVPSTRWLLSRISFGLAAFIALALSPGPAAAQEGLDLNAPDNPPPEEPKKPEPPTPKTEPRKPGQNVLEGALGAPGERERDTALEDRVKAVQRKGFLKRGRFEAAPLFVTSVNDAFFQKVGGGIRLAYNLQDSFAIAVRGAYYTPFRTDNVREGKLAFQSQLLTSQLYGQVMASGVWAPIYGKVSVFNKRIIHFDLFLSAGLGAVWSATSLAPRSEGPHVAADFGGGVRFYPKDWLAVEVGLLDTLYPDQPITSVPSTTQKVLVANIGLSFFLPTRFEYVYP